MAKRVVIVGAGLTGLTTAYYVQKEAAAKGHDVEVVLVEATDRVGGKINTIRRDGFVIEKGPDSFLARKTPMVELAIDLGIEQEITGQNPKARTVYLVADGKLHTFPPHMVLGVPMDLEAFRKNTVLSTQGTERALQDVTIPPRASTEDESLASLLTRRFGQEMVDRFSEPLLGGVHAGSLDQLGVEATFPQFAEYEREYGSLIRGTQESIRVTPNRAAALDRLPVDANTPFVTFRHGLTTLIEALDGALPHVTRKLGAAAQQISHTPVGATTPYELVLANGERIGADTIVLTTPTFVMQDLLAEHVNVEGLRAIQYVSVGNMIMGFKKATLDMTFDGTGFVIPSTEGTRITACTWTSAKWRHTAPDDYVVLRVYIGHAGDELTADVTDEELVASAQRDIFSLMGITAEPAFYEITRLPNSMPQYPVGHLSNIAAVRAEMADKLPNVYFCGQGVEGVGMPDVIRQGRDVARDIVEKM
jgi:oxygen-dependent protoporphyrinogen oxidase